MVQRKTGILLHFTFLHTFLSCLIISSGLILFEVYNSLERFLPFLADVIFRVYAILILHSIHKKYQAEEKAKMANFDATLASENSKAENLSQTEAQNEPKPQNIFEKYAEIAGYVLAGVNFVAGIFAMPYFLLLVFRTYINENMRHVVPDPDAETPKEYSCE